jgi:hypothetical protein
MLFVNEGAVLCSVPAVLTSCFPQRSPSPGPMTRLTSNDSSEMASGVRVSLHGRGSSELVRGQQTKWEA